ncbi:TldD/PmbA family protein [Sedimentibacter sp. zth1]|uniref:TldD/PmbA family protein n=1 Tax=Sedimentibacter sp. zth1 TaxID=2816908 RepID=UPI001A9130F0|nr:TldD/PmbA family protein [Sedimentibacter sp. zth1]QSX06116.1 TldD/PmbA family protein [Sedimentibacter sp. zth1]
MEKKILIDKIFQYGKQLGLQDMEISYNSDTSFDIGIFKQEIDNYSLSDNNKLSLKVIYNGKLGNSYTEKIDETSIEMLVNEAIENAKIISSSDEVEIFAGSKNYTSVNTYNENSEKVSDIDKINFAKKAEEIAYSLDKRIVQVQDCMYIDGTEESILANTKGLNLQNKSNYVLSYIGVVANDGKQIKSSYSFACGRDFSKLDPEEMATEAVKKALSMLGAKSIKSGNYPIIIKNETMGDLLSSLTSIFSAENVQKNLSLLKDKLNKKIASSMLTIVDDPFMECGLASRSYDSEGAACTYKKLIDKGILKSYLYNLKTAKKDNVETTGNSLGSSRIGPSNFYIENGNNSLENIMNSVKEGLLITGLDGLHAGLNAISGDFSLSASGYLIENGTIKHPVEQITVAGNFFEMIKSIEDIANDLKFGLPGESYIGSPSIKFKGLAVAGE